MNDKGKIRNVYVVNSGGDSSVGDSRFYLTLKEAAQWVVWVMKSEHELDIKIDDIIDDFNVMNMGHWNTRRIGNTFKYPFLRKYFVENDGNFHWFEASHSGLEDAIQFAQNNKANVETLVDWQDLDPWFDHLHITKIAIK